MSEELKPCPCCQGTDLVGGETETDCVYCKTCWLRAVSSAAWNTRAQPKAAPVEPVARPIQYDYRRGEQHVTTLQRCDDVFTAEEGWTETPLYTRAALAAMQGAKQ